MTNLIEDFLRNPFALGDGPVTYIDKIEKVRQEYGRGIWIGKEHPQYSWVLGHLVRTITPKNVLELGFQCGGSAYGILHCLPEGSLYVGVDNENSPVAGCAMSDFHSLFPNNNAVYIIGDADKILPILEPVWDLVHFDHYKDRYLPDLELLIRRGKITRDTVVVFHDSDTWAKGYVNEAKQKFSESRYLKVNEGAVICWGLK